MYNKAIRFDLNEWVVLLSGIWLFAVFFQIKKRYPPILVAIIWMMFSVLGMFVDQMLATQYSVDLYDTLDYQGFDPFDTVIYFFSYPLYGYMFCHLYKIVRERLPRSLLVFKIGWSVQSTAIEWLSSLLGIYTYKGWSPLYSLLFYLVLFQLMPQILSTLERWWESESKHQQMS